MSDRPDEFIQVPFNDLDALAIGPDEGDHPDLDGGKRTLVLWTAHRLLPAAGRLAYLVWEFEAVKPAAR